MSARLGSDILVAIRAILRNRLLLRVLAAFCLFNAAEFGSWVAILVYAFGQGGTVEAGVVGFLLLVPPVFAAPLGSVLADRMQRGRALGLGYLVQAATFAVTAAALALDAPSWLVYIGALLSTCAVTLTRPAHLSILPDLSSSPQELIAANSASATLEQLGVLLGPLANAVLVIVGGPALVFGVMAAGLAGSCALTWRLHALTSAEPAAETHEGRASSVLADTRDGVRELRRDAGSRSVIALAGMHWLVLGMLEVLVIALAIDVLDMGEAGPATLLAGAGLGGFLGAIGTVALVGRARLTPVLLAAALTIGLPLLAVPTIVAVAAAIALLALSGVGSVFFDVSSRTLLQRFVADEYRSRVFGIQESVQLIGAAVGAAAAPVVVSLAGARGAFVVTGACMPILAAVSWRTLRAQEVEVAPPGAALEALRRVSPFDLLPTPTLEGLASRLIPVSAAAREVVIREGEPGDRFYIVAGGTLQVLRGAEPIATLEAGDYFGEIALLRDVPRTATVIAETGVELFALERAEFLATVSGSRALATHATAQSDRRLGEHADHDAAAKNPDPEIP